MKQPSKENILKAHDEGCDDAKKVIKNLWPDEFEEEEEFKENKIWAFCSGMNSIYLLTREDRGWAITNINDTSYIFSSANSAKECFDKWKKDGKKWQSFDSEKDFLKWALKQVS